MTSNALTTPSFWDVSFVEGAGLETSEDLLIVLKSIFPQGNIEITRRDEIMYRVKLPYCTKLTSIRSKFEDYENAVTIVSAGADLTVG